MKKKPNNRRELLQAVAMTTITNTIALGQGDKSLPKGARPRKVNARFINPPTLSKPRGYTHVVEVQSGRPVYIAGQVALDKDGNLVGKDDFKAQCVQVFENLKAALASVGADFSQVVKLNNYATDASQLQVFRDVRDQYVNVAEPPASTFVQVTKLAREEWLIEVEAIALLPQ
jgi:enamine deaminase RidA (YjgF/YER057c/UK114 family)